LTCSYGTCSIWIPTYAKHSLSSTFYIELESSGFTSDYSIPNERGQYARNSNLNVEKTTNYQLSATLGTANCGAPPSTGWCANSTIEGVNVWASVTNTVWSYDNSSLKDDEASCRFQELIERCPNPTEICRQWLKIFSCLESFPQCDSNGFQQGMCQDVCLQVELYCADFINYNHPEFTCCSSRYVLGQSPSNSTCYTIPPPPPPPATVTTNAPVDDFSQNPPPFNVPNFTTIEVAVPLNFDKAAIKGNHKIVNSSISTYCSLSLVLFAIIMLLF